MNKKNLLLFLLGCLSNITLFAQGTCFNPQPICGFYTSFSAPLNQPSVGPDGCLFTTPSPGFYVFQIAQSGVFSAGINTNPCEDMDFALYGPYFSPFGNCGGNLPIGGQIDCGYNGGSCSLDEHIDIANAMVGEYYILLISNYFDAPATLYLQPDFANTAAIGSNCPIFSGSSSCTGTIGDMQLSAVGGQSPYTFDVVGPMFLTSVPSGSYSGFPDGFYSITVTDAFGAMTTTYININCGSPTIGATVDCSGGPGNATVIPNASNGSPPYTYTISSPTSLFTGLADGTYTVTVTDANSNTAATSVLVSCGCSVPIPIVTKSDNLGCSGSVTVSILNISGPSYQYNWSNGATTEMISVSTPGTYTVTVTNPVGPCTSSRSIIVRQRCGTDPCVCSTTPGFLDEVVTVTGLTGETWTVTNIRNFDGTDDGILSGAAFTGMNVAIGTVLTETPPGSGIFTVAFLHQGGGGFEIAMTETATGDVVTIGNVCAAPNCCWVSANMDWGP